MLRVIIFDFDGVITDSEILHLRAFNRVLAQYGIEIPIKDYYKEYLGFTDLDCFKMLVEKGLLKRSEEQIKRLVKEKNEIFKQLATTEGNIMEGVRDFLDMLRQNGIRLAICSGAVMAEIELILRQANLRSYFEVIVAADHVREGKPSPEGFLLALQRLNENREEPILASQCVVIEDSHWGLKAGVAAKMHTVAITSSYDAEQLTQGEKIVSKLSDLSIEDLRRLCA